MLTVAEVLATAWCTVSNTGRSRCSRATTTRRDAADDARAIGDALLGVEGALLAGEALHDDPAALVDENAHGSGVRVTCGRRRRLSSPRR